MSRYIYTCHVSSTRERILGNALDLIEATPDEVPSMSALARTTGISRQALYLHFPERASLLLALVEYVDEREDLHAEVERVQAAPDGPAQVRAWAEMQARRNPRIAAVARALDQRGRRLPTWRGCRRLSVSQVFLLARHPDSFDSRYYGPVDKSLARGVAHALVSFAD